MVRINEKAPNSRCPSLPSSLPSSPSVLLPPLPHPLLPHPLQSALDASSRGGLDFQAEPQLALRVIIIHLRVLPPQPLPPAQLASPSPRPPPPPAVQTFLHACSGSPRGDSEFFFFYRAHDHHHDASYHGYHFLLPGRETTSAFCPPAPSPAKAATRAGPWRRLLTSGHPSPLRIPPSFMCMYIFLIPFYSSRSTAFRWNAAD